MKDLRFVKINYVLIYYNMKEFMPPAFHQHYLSKNMIRRQHLSP